jgi:hypothetical protein
MAETTTQIDQTYLEVLARHATSEEQLEWAALSQLLGQHVDDQITQIPEAIDFVDPVIRLYMGAFNRFPDAFDPNGDFDTGAQSGFWVNVNALRNGADVAQAFVASPEFQSLYGTTQVSAGLITAFYSHILARAPSSAEISAWQESGLDAAHILVGFTESIEFKALSQSAVNLEKLQLADNQYGIVFGQLLATPHAANANTPTSLGAPSAVAENAPMRDVDNDLHIVGSVPMSPDSVGVGNLHLGG